MENRRRFAASRGPASAVTLGGTARRRTQGGLETDCGKKKGGGKRKKPGLEKHVGGSNPKGTTLAGKRRPRNQRMLRKKKGNLDKKGGIPRAAGKRKRDEGWGVRLRPAGNVVQAGSTSAEDAQQALSAVESENITLSESLFPASMKETRN